MVESNGINRLVYDFFEARILFGYYSCGDNLPSISKICSMFNMATATVRTALARLEKKGYIRVDARKAPKVTYNALPEKVRENATIYLVRREKGIADIFRTGEYLFGSLWEAGVYRWDQDTLVRLRSALTTPAQGMVPMPIEFYLMAFDGLHNGLISSLYWDVIQYMMFPYLENHDDEELLPEVMKGNSLEEVITVLNRRLLEKNRQNTQIWNRSRLGGPFTGSGRRFATLWYPRSSGRSCRGPIPPAVICPPCLKWRRSTGWP